MSIITEKLQTMSANNSTIAENEQKIYDAGHTKGYDEGHSTGYDEGYDKGNIRGKSDGYGECYFSTWSGVDNLNPHPDSFWNGYQVKGKLRDYSDKFKNWSGYQYNPKYPVIIENGNECFYRFNNAGYNGRPFYSNFELGYTQTVDFSQATTAVKAFYESVIYRIKKIDLSNVVKAFRVFGYSEIKRIDEFTFPQKDDALDVGSIFWGASQFEYIGVVGTIKHDVSIYHCPKLTHDSLMTFINALEDKTADTSGWVWTLSMGSENLAKLTAEEKAIATQKGWVLI